MSTEREADALKAELRQLARNIYEVNEKRPPSYDRKWRLYVLHSDGESRTYLSPDTEAGQERNLRDALRYEHARADREERTDV